MPDKPLCVRLLLYLLYHAPLLKLLTCILLLIVGAAGCHHAGMWGMRGIKGTIVHARLTYASFATTVALGGAVCVVGVLAFLLCPRGITRIFCSAILAVGIACFHYSSTTWGMEYIANEPGLAYGPVFSKDAMIVLIMLQVCSEGPRQEFLKNVHPCVTG